MKSQEATVAGISPKNKKTKPRTSQKEQGDALGEKQKKLNKERKTKETAASAIKMYQCRVQCFLGEKLWSPGEKYITEQALDPLHWEAVSEEATSSSQRG